MHAAGEDDVVTRPHQLAHTAVARQRRGDRQAKFHIACGRFCQHVVDVFVQSLIIQTIKMAVGVD
jgi:hypothetical protein